MNILHHLIKISTVCIVMLWSVISPANAQHLPNYTFEWEGVERTYQFLLPDNLMKEAPLVFLLHGVGGNSFTYERPLIELAKKEGFALCIPKGKEVNGSMAWNVGYPYQEGVDTDDIGFLAALASYLQQEYHLNPLNTFCAGFSNGAEMCYYLAYSDRNIFTAVAPLSGMMLVEWFHHFTPPRPIPIFQTHGTDDEWEGDLSGQNKYGVFISVNMTTAYWVTFNQCKKSIREEMPRWGGPSGKTIYRYRYTDGLPVFDGGPAAEVWLYEVTDGGHGIPDALMDTEKEMWQFFSKYLR